MSDVSVDVDLEDGHQQSEDPVRDKVWRVKGLL